MKSGYALTIAFFLSVSAFVFFKGEARILQLLSGKEATTAQKDSSVQKKKVLAKVSSVKKTKKKALSSQTADLSSYLFQPIITATKTVDKTTEAVSGNVLNYTVTIANTGTLEAAGLTFTDDIDPNTTLVPNSLIISPIAFDDAYTAIGNVGMIVPDADGILANDEPGSNPPAVFTAVTSAATTQGGTISISAGGGLTYIPPVGFTGNDTYVYTLTNAAGSSTATINIAVSGMIWFVNNASVAATADGRINTPFNTVAAFQAINDGAAFHPGFDQFIFIHESSTDYTGNISLLSGQKLIGQDATTDLATITGYNTYPYSTTLLPVLNSTNTTIVNLTASGADNVITLAGGGSATHTIRGLTIGNKVTGSGITGTTFGTANISETSISGTGQALNLTTGVLNANFAAVSSSSGANAVSLTNITGTTTMGIGNLAGSTGATFNLSGGTVSVTYSGNISQANNAAMVNVAGSHSGTLTFQTGTLSATNGTGLQFTAANGTYNFNGTTTLNGGDAGVDILGTSLGSFVFSTTTAIINPSGTAFSIGAAGVGTGGSGSVTYNGTISKNNSGKVIEIQNKTAGTVAFTGSVASTGTSAGINLLANTGAVINFSGGLNLSTATNTAFNATGGGTVSATQNNTTLLNTITTTTGTGVNIANTTIGAGGLTFRSINVNGASKAVSLNTTGNGGFTIIGTGAAGTGGTIQNISTRGLEFISANNINLNYLTLTNANTTDGAAPCDDNGIGGCNAAIYISSATGVTLNSLNVTTTAQQGLNLNGVTALTINNCTIQGNGNGVQEGALKARNILGTSSITNSLFKNSAYRIGHIINTSGSAHLTINNCTFTNDAFDPASPAGLLKQDCFEMRTQSTATATVLIKNSTFTRAGSYGIQLAAEGNSSMTPAITNCTVDRSGQQMAGIAAIADGSSAVMNANIDGNPLIQSSKEVAVNVFSGIGGTMQATVRSNTSPTGGIQGGNNRNANAFANVFVHAIEQSNNKVLMNNNKVEFTDLQAIQLATHDGTTNTLNATVENNTVITQNNAGNVTAFVIQVSSNTLVPGSTSPACGNIRNNAITLTNPSASQPYTFEVETGAASSLVNLQSNSGTNQTNITNLWVNNGNTPTDPARLLEQKTSGSTINYGGVTCPQPTNLVLPTAIASLPLEVAELPADLTLEPVPASTDFATAKFELPPAEEEAMQGQPQPPATGKGEAFKTSTAQTIIENTTAQNITLSGINLPAAKSLTIKFQVTINNGLPANVCAVSNQGSVSGGPIVTPVLTDNDNNPGSGINPTITTILDETDPEITCPTNITVNTAAGQCSAIVNFTGANAATATDNCGTPTISYSPVSGSSFAKGTTTVTATATDAAGNTASCTFTVTITDNEPPSINCPQNLIVNAPAGQFIATVDPGTPTGSDNCVTVSFSGVRDDNQPLDAPYPVGTTTIVWTATDGSDLTATCNQTITVNDVTPPTVTIDQAAGQADPTGNTTIYFTAVFSEPVTGFATGDVTLSGTAGATTVIVTEAAPNNGTTYQVAISGMTVSGTVTASIGANKAVDASNNGNTASTSTDNTVTYTACQIIPPLNIVVDAAANQCGAIVDYNIPEPIGNCGVLLATPASGSFFPVGTTTVIITSEAGASSSFTVTVQDNQDPKFTTCPAGGDLGINPTYIPAPGEAVATDNCGTPTIIPTIEAVQINGCQRSRTTVYVATDASGRTATCYQTFTWIEDHTAPSITCPINIEENNTPGTCGKAVSFNASASDGCGGAVTVKYFIGTTEITSPHTFPVGTTTVNVTATDVAGNVNACSFTVTIKDTEAPVITTCPGNQNVNTAPNQCEALVSFSATASDNCPDVQVKYYLNYGASTQQEITSPHSFLKGDYAVTVKAIDASGNMNATLCGFTVTVDDNQDPTISAPPPVNRNTGSSTCTVYVSDADLGTPTVNDNCPGVDYQRSGVPANNLFPVGVTTITYTAMDAVGRTKTATQTVTITDNTAPVFTTNLTASPDVLWPPDHKLKDITLNYGVYDACGCTPVITVTSSDPISGVTDGDKFPDWVVVNDHLVQLRAERGNGKEARVYKVKVSCADASNNSVSQEVEVRIAHNITAPQSGTPFKIGSSVNFAGVFWDKPGNKHTANWLIDDKTTAKATVTEPSGMKNGKVAGSYKFAAPGVYKLQMNVTDQNGLTSYCNTNEDLEAIIVIYDPNGGYTYGGGNFRSPAGALIGNPTATGLVSYGFTVNYYKGATFPKGETQFEFKVGEFEFNAVNFDYLAVSGARAQFSGLGKIIGGQSGIAFIMTVVDGQLDGTGVDKIRMKIYNKNTGAVIYDNMPWASESADPTIAVGVNSSVVIAGGKTSTPNKKGAVAEPSGEDAAALTVTASPNPSRNHFVLTVESVNTKDVINMRVVDGYGRAIETRKLPAASMQMIRFGDNLRPGWYLVEIGQGTERKQLKLLKLSD